MAQINRIQANVCCRFGANPSKYYYDQTMSFRPRQHEYMKIYTFKTLKTLLDSKFYAYSHGVIFLFFSGTYAGKIEF